MTSLLFQNMNENTQDNEILSSKNNFNSSDNEISLNSNVESHEMINKNTNSEHEVVRLKDPKASEGPSIEINPVLLGNAINPARFTSQQLLSMVQQLAEQDVRKMFAGIQKTHFNAFEEAKTWDGKLPPRKPIQKAPKAASVEESNENITATQNENKIINNVSDYSSDIDTVYSDLTNDDVVTNSVYIEKEEQHPPRQERKSEGRNIGTEKKIHRDSQKTTQQIKKLQPRNKPTLSVTNTSRGKQSNQAISRRGTTTPSEQRVAKGSGSQTDQRSKQTRPRSEKEVSTSTLSKKTSKPEDRINLPPRAKSSNQVISQTSKDAKRRSSASTQKLQFDEATSIDEPYCFDENVQTSPSLENAQMQMDEDRKQIEEAIPTAKHRQVESSRLLDLRRGEETRKVALESFSPKKQSTSIKSTTSQRDTTKPQSKLQRERAKRKQVLSGRPQRKVARPPSPSALQQKHAKIAEIARLQREEEAKRRQNISRLPIYDVENDDGQSRRSSFSARMLPSNEIEDLRDSVDNVQGKQLSSEENNAPPSKNRDVRRPSKSQNLQISDPNETNEFETNSLIETAENINESFEEPSLIVKRPDAKKLKLFEILKQNLIQTRESRIEEPIQEAIPVLIEVKQTSECAQMETIIKSTPKAIEPQKKEEVKDDIKYDTAQLKNKEVNDMYINIAERPILNKIDTENEKSSPPITQPDKSKPKKTQPTLDTEDTRKIPELRESSTSPISPTSLTSHINKQKLKQSEIQDIFNEMDKYAREEEEIRKRLLESRYSPSPSISSTSSSTCGKSPSFIKTKKRPRIKVHTSDDFRRSSFSMSKILSPIRSSDKAKESHISEYSLSESERNEILAIKADIDRYWMKTANSIGEVCADVQPHVLFEIIADVIQEEVFEDCCKEVHSICDEAVQNIVKVEFDASSFQFSSTHSSQSSLMQSY